MDFLERNPSDKSLGYYRPPLAGLDAENEWFDEAR
jgi:hypothetical protein